MLMKCIHSAVLIKPPQNISQLYKKVCKHVNSWSWWYNNESIDVVQFACIEIISFIYIINKKKNTVLSFAIVCWIFNRFIQLYWEVCLTILIVNRKLLPSLSLSVCVVVQFLIVHGFYLYNVIVLYRNRYCLQEKNWSTLYHI